MAKAKGNSGGDNGQTAAAVKAQSKQSTGVLRQALDSIKLGFSGDFSKIQEEIDKQQSSLTESLNNMGNYMSDMVANIVNLGVSVTSIKKDQNDRYVIEDNAHAKETEDRKKPIVYTVDTTSADVTKLAGLPDTNTLIGNGFALLYNSFNTAATNILGKLTEMQKVMVTGKSPVSSAPGEKGKPSAEKKEDKSSGTNETIKNFLKESAGPIANLAGAILNITISLAILSLLPVANIGIGLASVAAITTMMIGTFFLFKMISQKWPEIVGDKADPNKKDSDNTNLYHIIDSISKLVLKLTLSIAIMTVVLQLTSVGAFVGGLVGMFGALIGAVWTVVTMSILIPDDQINQESDLYKLVDSIGNLVLKLSLSAILLGVFATQAIHGMGVEVLVLLEAIGLFYAINSIVNESKKQNLKQIEQVSDLMKIIGNTIMIISITAIVLGLIPASVIASGIARVVMVEALAVGLFYFINKIVTESQKQNPKQIEQVTNLIKAIGTTILIIGVLVIILGILPIGVILQGIIAVTLMFTLVIVATKILAQIKPNPLVFIAIGFTSLVVVAIAALALLLAIMFPDGLAVNAMKAAVAVILVTGAIVLVAISSSFLVPFGVPAMAMLIPFKIMAIAFTAVIIAAVVGVAWVLGQIPDTIATNAIRGALTVILTTTAIVTVALASTVLAALYFPLMFTTNLAISSIGLILGVIVVITAACIAIGLIGQVLAAVDLEPAVTALKTGLLGLGEIAILIALYTAPMVIAAGLSMVMATALMILDVGITVSVGCIYLMGQAMQSIQGLRFPTETFESMEASMIAMNKATEAAEKVKMVGLGTYFKIKMTVDAMHDIYNSVAWAGNKAGQGAKGIDALASALERLAATSPQLSELAQSMRDVATATKELNSLDVNANMSVEKMSGESAGKDAQDLKGKLQDAKEAGKQDQPEPSKDYSETLTKILQAIQAMVPQIESASHSQESQSRSGNKGEVTRSITA